jgi:hypothetical protein
MDSRSLRRVFLEITSPAASQNKRLLEEKDPEQRRKDLESMKAAVENPDVARLMMAFPFKVIGDPLHSKSRWRNIDPTAAAGIELNARRYQMV